MSRAERIETAARAIAETRRARAAAAMSRDCADADVAYATAAVLALEEERDCWRCNGTGRNKDEDWVYCVYCAGSGVREAA